MEKTKHIHDMVLHQKATNEPVQKSSTNYNRRYREHQRNQNYYPSSYKRQYNSQHHQQRSQPHHQDQFHPKHQPNFNHFSAATTENNMAVVNTCSDNNNNLSQQSEGFVEDNWFYNDNCNYL